MSALGGGIAALFGEAFGGLYLPATLYGAAGPVYAADGEITGWDGAGQACRAQIDAADWTMRQSEGFVDGDVRILILAHGLTVQPTNDSEIVVEAPQYSVPGGYQRWALSGLSLDAAGSHWSGRGRKAG